MLYWLPPLDVQRGGSTSFLLNISTKHSKAADDRS